MTNRKSNGAISGTDREQSSNWVSATLNFFREHPAILISVLYLQVTTLGVVYSWSLFRRFDINIFDYAETNDFLMAAFKDPTVFLLSGFNLSFNFVLFFLGVASGSSARRKRDDLERLRIRSNDKKPRSPRIKLLGNILAILGITGAIALNTLYVPYSTGNETADSMLGPKYGPLTTVQYRATTSSTEPTRETGLRVIGTTQSFVFFYDRKDTRTLVIPTAQIVAMEHDGPKGEPKENQQ